MRTIEPRHASQDQTLLHIGRIRHDWTNDDAEDTKLPDGDRNACRVTLDQNGFVVECNGRIGICYPWSGPMHHAEPSYDSTAHIR